MSLRIISGKFKGRTLSTPKGKNTRPTQEALREALFNICQNSIASARVLDLFAGSGAIGFESLSRGAGHVTFVEKDQLAISCIKKNIEMLDVKEQTTLFSHSALLFLEKANEPFDLIYIDPPYEMQTQSILKTIVEKKLLVPDGVLFVEELHSSKKPQEIPGLTLKSTRRFGVASLLEYYGTV